MFGKISIRNIPIEIWSGLEVLAKKNERSTEAEARYALRSWVTPEIQRNERSARRNEVSTRLREALDKINQVPGSLGIKPSHIAQEIDEDYAEKVENWFTGEEEPPLKKLEAIANYLGCSSPWLIHGGNHIFTVKSAGRSVIPDDPAKCVAWLVDLNEKEKVEHLYLVREANEAGVLMVVKKYKKWHCKTYITAYHVSEVTGNGGKSALAHFSVSLELLYNLKNMPSVTSHLLSPAEFKALYEGSIHPLVLLNHSNKSTWWEDFWDESQFIKCEYWQGWKAVCEATFKSVQRTKHLQEIRDLIREGQYKLPTDEQQKEFAVNADVQQ